MSTQPKHILYHIPVCPFSQRIEVLLSLKNVTDEVAFRVVDITRPGLCTRAHVA